MFCKKVFSSMLTHQPKEFFLQIRFSKAKSYENDVRRNNTLHLITYKIHEEITGHIVYDIERFAFENEDRQRKCLESV